MSATDPGTPKPRRFAIRLPRPLWIGAATAVTAIMAVGLRFGLPVYRQQAAVRNVYTTGGWVTTRSGGPDWLRERIGDERMKYFDEVERVEADGTGLHDSTLSGFRNLKGLTTLRLADTEVSDAGLANLFGMSSLEELSLARTNVGDAGIAYLTGLLMLQSLNLDGTRVTDAGLAHLRGLSRLRGLSLRGT